ncbi:MAG: polysaccharide deacetylase family protein [Calothrix sp. FI2-JRJ7]|jgi:peptidoglycan/xylan/chitin deacetylase (PgdA/CDA1 family)|nr:polysaccharide deacetylase family protein [Calothrix sp. FI2-JRJ7]
MLKRRNYIIITTFLLSVYFCILASYQTNATELKQSRLQLCNSKNIGTELEPIDNQELFRPEILFKTKSFGTLSLPAVPFPSIHPTAKKAKIPVMMYHDIIPEKKVIYDLTPQELNKDFEIIKAAQITPISINKLVAHLRTGSPLPKKPILLTFDDGYGGHYEYAYPLLKKYGYPAVFAVHTSAVGINTGRSHVTWQQLKSMVNDPLITISSHSRTHPALTKISDKQLEQEIIESKRLLESKLNKKIIYFTYPYGNYDSRVKKIVSEAGYVAAIAFGTPSEMFAAQSEDLFAISRFEKSRLESVIPQASGNPTFPNCNS